MPRRTGPSSLTKGIGKRIRALREEAGVTQEQLAWDCDLNKGYMSQIESGKHLPSVATLHAIAERLGVELADLVAFNVGKPRAALIDAVRRKDREDVVRALRELGFD